MKLLQKWQELWKLRWEKKVCVISLRPGSCCGLSWLFCGSSGLHWTVSGNLNIEIINTSIYPGMGFGKLLTHYYRSYIDHYTKGWKYNCKYKNQIKMPQSKRYKFPNINLIQLDV